MTREFRQLEHIISPAAATKRTEHHRNQLLTEKARRYLVSIDTAGSIDRIKGMLYVLSDDAYTAYTAIFYGLTKNNVLNFISKTKPESVGVLFSALAEEHGWHVLTEMTDDEIEARLNMFEY